MASKERKRLGRRSVQDTEETKQHILSIAADLFCELGYARVSLRNISDKAGVSHGLLRHHFGSKEQIWHQICDKLHHYNETILLHILNNMPQNAPINVKLYLFSVRLLAQTLVVQKPVQLIADAIRQQDDALFDYFIDSGTETKNILTQLAEEYNQAYSASPINIWEVKWQIIMYAHSAVSLTPFLYKTWKEEADGLPQCLLKLWQMFNDLMADKFHIDESQKLLPNSIEDLIYPLLTCK